MSYGLVKVPLVASNVWNLYSRCSQGLSASDKCLVLFDMVSDALDVVSLFTNAVPQIKLVEMCVRVISLPLYFFSNTPHKVEEAAACSFSILRTLPERSMLTQSSLVRHPFSKVACAMGIGELICRSHLISRFHLWMISGKNNHRLPEDTGFFQWFSTPLSEKPITWSIGGDHPNLPKNWTDLCDEMERLDTLEYVPPYLECDASAITEGLPRCAITNRLTLDPLMPSVERPTTILPYYDRKAFEKWRIEHPGEFPPKWPNDFQSFSVIPTKHTIAPLLRKLKQNFFKNAPCIFASLFKDGQIKITPLVWNLLSGATCVRDIPWSREIAELIFDPHQCPITLQRITDPVRDPTSRVAIYYQRSAIEHWLARNKTSPLTRRPLEISQLIECPDYFKELNIEVRAMSDIALDHKSS